MKDELKCSKCNTKFNIIKEIETKEEYEQDNYGNYITIDREECYKLYLHCPRCGKKEEIKDNKYTYIQPMEVMRLFSKSYNDCSLSAGTQLDDELLIDLINESNCEKIGRKKYMKKVFLGGTCAETVWREKLISMLKIDYFNPVVEDWTEECMIEEIKQRELCDYCLYVITPSIQGVYSIAEVVDDSNKRPNKTVFCVLSSEIPINQYRYPGDKINFSISEMKSLNAVGKMIEKNGGKYFKSLEEVANYLNA